MSLGLALQSLELNSSRLLSIQHLFTELAPLNPVGLPDLFVVLRVESEWHYLDTKHLSGHAGPTVGQLSRNAMAAQEHRLDVLRTPAGPDLVDKIVARSAMELGRVLLSAANQDYLEVTMAALTPSRIIPVSKSLGAKERETRATSALLAVLGIVRPFSKALLGPMGASRADKATVKTFIETSYKTKSGKPVRPDGLIKVSYGNQDAFCMLVEVKTGDSLLKAGQINDYVDVARKERYDAVLTISNEISLSPGVHPTAGLAQRKNSKVKVHHVSWTRLLTMAVTEKVHHGVSDPEQAWILGELIRYMRHESSGVMSFDDMGPNWLGVRDKTRDRKLTSRSSGVEDIARRWDQRHGLRGSLSWRGNWG